MCLSPRTFVISGGVTIRKGCFLGVNATLSDHITLGEESVIGAGALILGDTEPHSVYVGTKTEARAVKSHELKRM